MVPKTNSNGPPWNEVPPPTAARHAPVGNPPVSTQSNVLLSPKSRSHIPPVPSNTSSANTSLPSISLPNGTPGSKPYYSGSVASSMGSSSSGGSHGGNVSLSNTSKTSLAKLALVRTSSLDPSYIRNNLATVNAPVRLSYDNDLADMILDWSPEERENSRRLVKFKFWRKTPTEYSVQFTPIAPRQYDHTSPIISCIYWKERDMHIVTSVDIILILEYLVQESFSIEEKNRIRRNLQSLKPYTVSRSNKSFERFFKLLMSMEDPRPRNIEQDLKVFKWGDLFKAINKVISKYSVVDSSGIASSSDGTSISGSIPSRFSVSPTLSAKSLAAFPPQPQASASYARDMDNHLKEHINNHKMATQHFSGVSSGIIPISGPPASYYQYPEYAPSGLSQPQPRPIASTSVPKPAVHSAVPPVAPSTVSSEFPHSPEPVFVPSERIKVLKRKLNRFSPQTNTSATGTTSVPNYHNNLFHHALKPSDPVPMAPPAISDQSDSTKPSESPGDADNEDNDSGNVTSAVNEDSPISVASPPEGRGVSTAASGSAPIKNTDSPSSVVAKSDDATISGSDESPSSSGESRSNSASNVTQSKPSSRVPTHHSSMTSGLSSNVFSRGSFPESMTTSGGGSVGSLGQRKDIESLSKPGQPRSIASLVTQPEPKPEAKPPISKEQKEKSHHSKSENLREKNRNLAEYASDQRHRVIGNPVQAYSLPEEQSRTHSHQYYQYPAQSMLYNNQQDKANSYISNAWKNPAATQKIPSLANVPMPNPLSTSNIQKHDLEQSHKHRPQKSYENPPRQGFSHLSVQNPFIPSMSGAHYSNPSLLRDSVADTSDNSIKLPPIRAKDIGSQISSSYGGKSGVKLPGPSEIGGYWNNFSTPALAADRVISKPTQPSHAGSFREDSSPEQPPQKVQATVSISQPPTNSNNPSSSQHRSNQN